MAADQHSKVWPSRAAAAAAVSMASAFCGYQGTASQLALPLGRAALLTPAVFLRCTACTVYDHIPTGGCVFDVLVVQWHQLGLLQQGNAALRGI